MTETAIETIKRFVAGEITPHEFRDRIYNDDTFETLLTNDPHLTASDYVFSSGSAYHFVLAQDYDDPGGVLNAHGALCDFLDRNDIEYSTSDQYSGFYDLILDAQPAWLAVDSKYVADHILPGAAGRSGSELKQWLAAELTSRFRYINQPPTWIQSPDWPIGDNGPLVFLGQLEIKDYFHDDASAYVFHDQVTGCCETVVQVY
jgi:hypothetical protein